MKKKTLKNRLDFKVKDLFSLSTAEKKGARAGADAFLRTDYPCRTVDIGGSVCHSYCPPYACP